MELTPGKRRFLIVMPFLLTSSTALAFSLLASRLGVDWGYVLGFGFYWIWCLSVPLVVLGRDGFASMFREGQSLFRRENWLLSALLCLPLVGALVIYFIPNAGQVSTPILLFAPIAIVNGSCEEILWRGTYVAAFPRSVWLACVYPSLGFALSHLSPELVYPAEGSVLPFVISTFFLGLAYAWVTYRTGSVKWAAISHSLIGLLAFGEPLSSSIARLVFP